MSNTNGIVMIFLRYCVVADPGPQGEGPGRQTGQTL